MLKLINLNVNFVNIMLKLINLIIFHFYYTIHITDGKRGFERYLCSFLQSKDAGDSDSEKEQEELGEIENVLKKHDPTFLA